MISMSEIWDRTVAVLAGRFAMLASIATLLLLAPPIAQAAIDAISGTSPALRFVGGLVALLVFVAAMLGALAVTAVATDPSLDQRGALEAAGLRVGPLLAVSIVLGIVLFASFLPAILLIGTSGFDIVRAQAGAPQQALDTGRFALGGLFMLVTLFAWLWVFAKLVPLPAVVMNERRGLGAIARSFALTRGSTAKLFGVLILYAIVMAVALMAVTSVLGLVTRLIAGPGAPGAVAFVVAVGTAIVTCVFSVVQNVFGGQYYLKARAVREAA